jgi:hypothetical protein
MSLNLLKKQINTLELESSVSLPHLYLCARDEAQGSLITVSSRDYLMRAGNYIGDVICLVCQLFVR